jgi:diketogulonate reductase-like aldo/keto reductase
MVRLHHAQIRQIGAAVVNKVVRAIVKHVAQHKACKVGICNVNRQQLYSYFQYLKRRKNNFLV